MRKVIASMNMTLDGFCDHTSMNADEELHDYYTDMLRNAGALVYGRTTYQLMEDYWPRLVQSPSGDKSMDDFALSIHNVPKLVFSRTLRNVSWNQSTLATHSVTEEITSLRNQPGNDIYVGSPSMIVQTLQLHLLDELHLCINPVIVGHGLVLFKNIQEKVGLKLINTRNFGSGVVGFQYRIEK